MGHQFIHEECFARTAAKSKTGGHSIRSIIAETDREHDACPHVWEPQRPQLLYGVKPAEVEEIATEWGDNSKDAMGRKLRADAPCMIAGVISIDNDETPEDWENCKKQSIEWLQRKYGERLKSVVEHTDESHRHCHYYVVPNPGESFDSIHSGKKLAREAKEAKLNKGQQNAAYIAGMRAFQDDYYLSVGSKLGQTRLGPKRFRWSRAEWQAQKHDAKLKALVDEQRQKIYDEAYQKGLQAGNQSGYSDGYQEGVQDAKSIGAKVGTFVANTAKNAVKKWHTPTIEAQNKVRGVVKAAKKHVAQQAAQSDRKVAETQNALHSVQSELNKAQRVIKNLEIDNKRMAEDLAYNLSSAPRSGNHLTI